MPRPVTIWYREALDKAQAVREVPEGGRLMLNCPKCGSTAHQVTYADGLVRLTCVSCDAEAGHLVLARLFPEDPTWGPHDRPDEQQDGSSS